MPPRKERKGQGQTAGGETLGIGKEMGKEMGLVLPSSRESGVSFRANSYILVSILFPKLKYGSRPDGWLRDEALQAMQREQKAGSTLLTTFRGRPGPEEDETYYSFRQRIIFRGMRDKGVVVTKEWNMSVDYARPVYALWFLYLKKGKGKRGSSTSRSKSKTKSKSKSKSRKSGK